MDLVQRVLAGAQSAATDAFWDTVTSIPVLLVLGAIVIAGALARLIPATIFPQLAAWLSLVRVAGVLSAFAIAFLIGHRVADNRDAVTSLRRDLAFAETELAQQRASAAQKDLLATASLANADALKTQVDDYVSKLAAMPARAVCILSDDDARRLRDIKPRRAVTSGGATAKGLRRFGVFRPHA